MYLIAHIKHTCNTDIKETE